MRPSFSRQDGGPKGSHARVRITAGDTPLNAGVLSSYAVQSEPRGDVVAMDDFIYGEPRARH